MEITKEVLLVVSRDIRDLKAAVVVKLKSLSMIHDLLTEEMPLGI